MKPLLTRTVALLVFTSLYAGTPGDVMTHLDLPGWTDDFTEVTSW